MTSANPPSIITNTYNPSFFTSSSTSGLSQSQADSLYLKKTTPDTATALETFSNGIVTNSLNTTSTSSNLTIGTSTNTGTVTIATINTGNTNVSPAISIGADSGVKTIKINNNSNSVHCSSIDLNGSTINNIANGTGVLSIGDKQTSGILNIGTGGSRTGQINIGSSSNSCVCDSPFTANNGFTMANSNNITLSTGSVAPTSTQLGYIIPNIYATTTTLVNATDTTILTQSLTAGTWLLSYQFRLTVPTTAGTTGIFLIKIIVGSKCLANNTTYTSEVCTVGSASCRSGSVVVNFLTATNVSLQYFISSSAVFSILGANTSANDNTYLQCTRIA